MLFYIILIDQNRHLYVKKIYVHQTNLQILKDTCLKPKKEFISLFSYIKGLDMMI